MKINFKNYLFFVIIFLFTSCNNFVETQPEVLTTNILIGTSTNDTNKKIDEYIKTMSIEEKVGQMFIVSPNAFAKINNVTSLEEINIVNANKYSVGGYIMQSDNIVNPTQITNFNKDLQSLSKLPLFICIEESGGVTSAIVSNKNFPNTQVDSFDNITSKNAYDTGRTVGGYLSKYGFNVNFAPITSVDIDANRMTSIYDSFSDNPYIVADLALAFANGLQSREVFATINNFPGSSQEINEYTLNGFYRNYKSLDALNANELIPIKKLMNNDVDFIMVNNVIYPTAFHENVPSSLNYEVVTGLLREGLGFDGLIITEKQNNGAIAKNYKSEDATIRAIIAGNDIILMPLEFDKSYTAVLDAVKDGIISEERIDESVKRILLAKSKL